MANGSRSRTGSSASASISRRRETFSWSISVGDSPASNLAQPIAEARRIRATAVFPDDSIQHLLLVGDDGARFNRIRELIEDIDIAATAISDQDGPAAIGWTVVGSEGKGLATNELASTLVDRTIFGPMVITGRGRGTENSMTSLHEGLRFVLDRMAREAAANAAHPR
jgi:hypothetical protein